MEADRAKTKSSLRTAAGGQLRPAAAGTERAAAYNEKLCGNCYNQKYKGYLFVDEMGNLILPNAVTDGFAKLLADHGLRKIRFHDLRHPYVKHTTKKYNSEKQKTQATKIDLIAWVFCFCIISYSKEVMDLVNNLNAVVGKDTHLFNQQIGQLGG